MEKKIFDGKLMAYGNKLADLMLLNLLAIIFSLPLVTIGPAYTAMHYVLFKIYRNEDIYIVKSFLHAFRVNFKSATIIWMIYGFGLVFIIGDFYLIYKEIVKLKIYMIYALIIVAMLVFISGIWAFVLLSRYDDSVKNTIKNSFIVIFYKPFCSILMLILAIFPGSIIYYFPSMGTVAMLLGLSGVGMLQTMLYSQMFDKLEHKNENGKNND